MRASYRRMRSLVLVQESEQRSSKRQAGDEVGTGLRLGAREEVKEGEMEVGGVKEGAESSSSSVSLPPDGVRQEASELTSLSTSFRSLVGKERRRASDWMSQLASGSLAMEEERVGMTKASRFLGVRSEAGGESPRREERGEMASSELELASEEQLGESGVNEGVSGPASSSELELYERSPERVMCTLLIVSLNAMKVEARTYAHRLHSLVSA